MVKNGINRFSVGRGFLTTKALAYMFDNPATLPIIGED